MKEIEINGLTVLHHQLYIPESTSMRALVVEAHPDDRIMGQGIDEALVREGVTVTVVTLTDGAGSTVTHMDPDTLAGVRRQESIDSVGIMGGDGVYNAMIPDMLLSEYHPQAKAVLGGLIEDLKPDLLITPHRNDPTPDHAHAHLITAAVSGGIPVYQMDAMTGRTIKNADEILSDPDNFDPEKIIWERINPTHYVPISRREKNNRNLGFDAHKSQMNKRDKHQTELVKKVKNMPKERGRELRKLTGNWRRRYASSLVYNPADYSGQDPIRDIFQKTIFVRKM